MTRIAIAPPDLCAVAFAVWAGLSLLWSPDPQAGLLGFINIAAVVVLFLWARRLENPGPLCWAAFSAVILCTALSLILPASDAGGFGNENFFAVFVVSAIPLALGVVVGRSVEWQMIALALILAVAGYLFVLHPAKTEWGVLLALPLVGALWIRKWVFSAIWVWVCIGLVYLSPIKSVTERLELAINTVVMWLHAPVLGHGLGSFNYLYPNFQEAHTFLTGPKTVMDQSILLPGSAHNEYLDVLSETGLIGLILAAAWVLSSFLQGGRLSGHRLAAAGSVVVLLVVSLYEFPLHDPATAALGALSLGTVSRGSAWRFQLCLRGPGKALAVASAIAGVGLAGWLSTSLFLGTAHHEMSKRLLTENPLAGFRHALKAWELWPYDPMIRLQLFASFMRWHDTEPTYRFDPESVDNLYDIARSASPHLTAVASLRVSYLVRSGRAPERASEIETLLAFLRQNAAMQPETWFAEMQYAAIMGDLERMREAFQRAKRTPFQKQYAELWPEIERIVGDADEAPSP